MTDRTDLIEQIRTLAVVHGKVTLASGREADYYVDMRRVTLDGVASPLVGRVMNELVSDLDFDAVGGLTLGADPVATAMLHARAAEGGTSTSSWCARRPRLTACSAGSRAPRSPGAACWWSRTPRRRAAPR